MREHLVSWTPPLAWAALIFAASSRQSVPVPSVWAGDKLSHLAAYLVLGALLTRAATRTRAPFGLTMLAGLLYAASDEWHQSGVPGRNPDVRDWVADAVGIVVGGVLVRRRLGRAA